MHEWAVSPPRRKGEAAGCAVAGASAAAVGPLSEPAWPVASCRRDDASRAHGSPAARYHGRMTSQRYIALLRGVNVGRAKRIAMADLRKLVESLGYTGVRSLLNSGNIIFDADVPADQAAQGIEEAMVLRLGVAARVFVLGRHELAAIIDDNPLLDLASDHARLFAFVLPGAVQRDIAHCLCGQDWTPEALAIGRHAAYVWCPEGLLDSAAAAALGKQLGDGATSRNWNTMTKLHGLCSDGGRHAAAC